MTGIVQTGVVQTGVVQTGVVQTGVVQTGSMRRVCSGRQTGNDSIVLFIDK